MDRLEHRKIYIRFTSDIYEDIDRGYSFDFRDSSKLNGLCAWGTRFATLEHSKEEIIEGCAEFAKEIIKNTYGGYSSKDEVAIIIGDYAGNSNDGCLLKNVEVLDTFIL